jgi:hypothetical protein
MSYSVASSLTCQNKYYLNTRTPQPHGVVQPSAKTEYPLATYSLQVLCNPTMAYLTPKLHPFTFPFHETTSTCAHLSSTLCGTTFCLSSLHGCVYQWVINGRFGWQCLCLWRWICLYCLHSINSIYTAKLYAIFRVPSVRLLLTVTVSPFYWLCQCSVESSCSQM